MEAAAPAAPAFGRPRPVVKPETPAGDSDDDRKSPSKQPPLIKVCQFQVFNFGNDTYMFDHRSKNFGFLSLNLN